MLKLTATEKDAQSIRENALKDTEKSLKKCQAAHNGLKSEVQQLRNTKDSLVAEIQGTVDEIAAIHEQIKACEVVIAKLQKDVSAAQVKVLVVKRFTINNE